MHAALTVNLLINPEADAKADFQEDLEDVSKSGREGSSGDAL